MEFLGGREHFFNPTKQIKDKIKKAKTTQDLDKIEKELEKNRYIPNNYKTNFQKAIDKKRKNLETSKSKSLSSFVPKDVKESTTQLKKETNMEELPESSGGFCNIL